MVTGRKEKEPSSRKSNIFECLRGRLSKNKGDHVSEREHRTPPKNAKKSQRKIKLGWMHFREGEFVQVCTKKGGGPEKRVSRRTVKKKTVPGRYNLI